jgi:hypothetical protein
MLRRLDRTFMLNITRVVADCVFEVDVKTDEERRFEGYLVTR